MSLQKLPHAWENSQHWQFATLHAHVDDGKRKARKSKKASNINAAMFSMHPAAKSSE